MKTFHPLLLIILISLSVIFTSCKKSDIKNDPYEYFGKAADLLEDGKYRTSIKMSEKAAALFKDFSAYENGEDFYYDCLTQIGEAYLRMGKVEKAQEQFEKTLDLSPANDDLILGIAAVYFRLNKISDGKAFFESSIKRQKGNPSSLAILYYYYALCLNGENDFTNAFFAIQVCRENYLKAGKEIPEHVEKFFTEVSEKSH